MNLEELRSRYKPQIMALADQFGVENIRVFRSTARGDAKPDNDVDFLVSIRPGTTLVDLRGLLDFSPNSTALANLLVAVLLKSACTSMYTCVSAMLASRILLTAASFERSLLWRLENLMNTKVDIVSDRKINKHIRDFILAEATPI